MSRPFRGDVLVSLVYSLCYKIRFWQIFLTPYKSVVIFERFLVNF